MRTNKNRSRPGTVRGRVSKWLVLGAVVLLGAGAASAQPAVNLTITNESGLDFGSIVATGSGGTVTLTPLGQRILNGIYGFGVSGYNAARFRVEADTGNPHYQIELPSEITLKNQKGNSLTVNNFQSLPATGGMLQPPQRIQFVDVGATLNVGAYQAAGEYEGLFPVTVHLGN